MTKKPAVSTNSPAPLDYLVAIQLAAIAAREKRLRQRYGHLQRCSSGRESREWARDVLSLQISADRLNRLVDAISVSY